MPLDYNMLANMPSVEDEGESMAIDPNAPPPAEEDEAEGLTPALRQLGKELGFSPKQAAALREFIAAAQLEQEEPVEEEADMAAPAAQPGY